MAVTFTDSIKELKEKNKGKAIKKIKLVNGEIVEGTIKSNFGDMLEILLMNKGAGSPTYTIPYSSILYISDCDFE